jgi:hypothetical protein
MTSERSFRVYDSTLNVVAQTGQIGRFGLHRPDWETYNRITKVLEAAGLRFQRDPRVAELYPSIAGNYHLGRWGDLQVASEIYPMGCKFEFFQDIVTENRHGGRYDFDRVAKMPYLVRKKFELCLRAVRQHLTGRGFVEHVKIDSPNPDPLAYFNGSWDGEYERRRGTHRFKRDETGWPSREEIGLACWGGAHDRNGVELRHGDLRYFRDHKGYLRRGRVYGGINGMWLVVYGSGRRDHTHLQCRELFLCNPASVPRKRHPRPTPLDKILNQAVGRQDFERAIVLRDLLATQQTRAA